MPVPWARSDPVAAQARLSGGPLCRQQRDLSGDRHPDPAVDPDHPLRPGQWRQCRGPVHRGSAARHHPRQRGSSRSAGGSRVGGATSPRRRRWVAASWRSGPAQQPGAADAGAHPARLALRLRDTDRDCRPDRDLLAGTERVPVPRPDLAPVLRRCRRGRGRHGHRHAGDHGQRRGPAWISPSTRCRSGSPTGWRLPWTSRS